MKKLNIQCLTLCSSIALLTACGGGGGSSSDATPEERSTPDGTVVATSTLVLPEQLEVVADSSSVTTASLGRRIASTRTIAAYNDSGTDYSNAEQRSHIWMEALEPIDTVNMILCFTDQFKATEFVNQGAYRVLVDDGKCDDKGGDGGSGAQNQQNGQSASSSSDTPSYLNVIVKSERGSDSDPMVVSAWIPDVGDGEMTQAVKFKATVYKGVSDDDPFGKFEFTYSMLPALDAPASQSMGGGEIKTVDVLDGFIGFTLYENFSFGPFGNTRQASVVMNADKSSGVALTASSFEGDMGGHNMAFGLAFDADHVLLQNNSDLSSLDYKGGNGGAGVCLSKTSFKQAVWRYGLYDATTGAEVELSSGFPITYDSDADGNDDSHGWVGYWGVWTERGQGLSNGDTIHKEIFGDSDTAPETYTVVKGPGKLTKHSAESVAVSEMAGVRFYLWDDTAQSEGFDQWVVKYLTAASDGVNADGFYKTAGMNWGENGQTETPRTPLAVSYEFDGMLHMYSDQLGGGVQYHQGDTSLVYYKETVLNGSESGVYDDTTGELALVCINQCPKGTLALADLDEWDAPYEAAPTNPNSFMTYGYTFHSTGDNMLALTADGHADALVKMTEGITSDQLQSTNFNWGVRSGPMVSASVAASLTNAWDIYNPSVVTEFYTWETGLDDWQQLTAVKDAQGAMVSFDRPIQFSYKHNSTNDRSGDAGEFAGQTFLMEYGGNGDLHGIPSNSVGDNRWYPAFNLADGVVMGPNGNDYVVKALEIEKKMAQDDGACTDLVINDPAAALPTAVVGTADIGDEPTVTAAPAVIAGEIQ